VGQRLHERRELHALRVSEPEALTARDRPYKSGKTLSESLAILGNFRKGGHIDPDLFDVFIRQKVYLRYAEKFLDAAQIDEVDESRIPGYQP